MRAVSVVVTSKPAVLPVGRRAAVVGRVSGRSLRSGRVRVRVVRLSGPGQGATGFVSRRGSFSLRIGAAARAGVARYRVVVGSARSPVFSVRVIKRPPGPGTGVTHALAPAQVLAAPAPGSGGTVRIAAGAAAPAVGDTLNAGIGPKTPYGMLLRVRTVRRVNGTVVATTVPARLDQVLPEGKITGQIPVTTESGPTRIASRAHAERLVAPCTGAAGLTIEGSAEVNATLEPVLEWGLIKPKRAGLVAEASASASASATASVSGSCQVDDIEILDRTLPPVTFSVGPVIVILVPEVEVELSGVIEAQAEMGASIDAGIAARAGLIREDGQFTKVAEVDKEFTHSITPPSANGKATGTVTTELSVLVYGAVGPTVTIAGGLELTADTTREPWWWLDGMIDANAAIELPILDLSSGTLDLYKQRFRLAQAPRRLLDAGATSTTATLSYLGEGRHDSGSNTLEATASFSGALAQHDTATATVPADQQTVEIVVPVSYVGGAAGHVHQYGYYSCGTSGGIGESTFDRTATSGGQGFMNLRLTLVEGRPVDLLVPDGGTNRADAVLSENGAARLMGEEKTWSLNCNGEEGTGEGSGPIPHHEYFGSDLSSGAVRGSGSPRATITPLGCAGTTCTYNATYGRSYTETGTGTWSAAGDVTLDTTITITFRMG